jgi:RimJ/RimL family protein N-acetyltransferase
MLHTGRIYTKGNVSLRPPHPQTIRRAAKSSDIAENIRNWLSAASERDDIYYFSIYDADKLVGQMILHDIDWQLGESLVGYHLFQPRYRGRGIGTQALELLKKFVTEWGRLAELIIITSADNLASQRIAQKCGFLHTGAPREDPNGVLLRWKVLKSKI